MLEPANTRELVWWWFVTLMVILYAIGSWPYKLVRKLHTSWYVWKPEDYR